MAGTLEAAAGHWPRLLMELGGLTADQLTNKHQPCPACGGKDRYRWDRDDGPGGAFCNRCGGKDHQGGALSGLDLLMRVRSWSLPDACAAVERHLGLSQPVPEPPTNGAEHVWRYTDTFAVCRFPGKRIRPLWWDGTNWARKAPPAPRPLYWARRAAGAPVLIAEGEKAADAAAQLFPSHAVCTWPSGCKAIDKADWQPLRGRTCILWPDADTVGREAMAKLAGRLLTLDCSVTVVNVPTNLAEGWDLADALAEGWTPGRAAKAVEKMGRPVEQPAAPEPEPAVPPSVPTRAADPAAAFRNHFTLLGYEGDGFYYQPHATGQVTRITRGQHTGTHLVAIAPIELWESLYPARTGVSWQTAASRLFQLQASVGVYNPDRIRGRGAWWDGSRSILHLGDRLVVDGTAQPASDPIDGRSLYQRAAALTGPGDARPLTDAEASILSGLAARFRWDVEASGLLLAGWVALAPICGALRWRPHIWLTGGAGSGKTAVLNQLMAPCLGDMVLHIAGNTSEAGVRQTLRADALPVIFDEAESNEASDRTRVQGMLALARVASSEGHAHMLKGSPSGEVTRFNIRSMFCMSSIATGLKQGADRSRFAQLTLRNPNEVPEAERHAHWEALRADLEEHLTPEYGQRLQARILQLIPMIRQAVEIFGKVAAETFDSQRLGDQYGTLLAGAWATIRSELPTEEEARQLVNLYSWESYGESTELPDERQCIRTILQHQIRLDTAPAVTRSIGELVDIAQRTAFDQHVTADLAEATLGRNGIRIEDDGITISNGSDAIRRILADTSWVNCWKDILMRIPGATRTTTAVYFKGHGSTSRGVTLPTEALS